MTQELIDNYPHKNSKYSPSRPYCRLCANLYRKYIRHTTPKFFVHIFRIGEQAIEVTYRNGTVAYYSPSCWNDPLNIGKVESIKRQEKANSSDMPSQLETYP